MKMKEFYYLMGAILVMFCLVRGGYDWAIDDNFYALIKECQNKGVIHRYVDHESLHVKCQKIEMEREWVEQ